MMYKIHKIYLFLAIVIICIFNYVVNISISESLIQNFITFLSITFGFYMTSLSVLYNSKYIKKLYLEIDKIKPTQRKIHTLKTYFTNSAFWSLFSIFILMIYSLVVKVDKNILVMNQFFETILIITVFINFVFIFLLFKVFVNGLIEEGKNNAK